MAWWHWSYTVHWIQAAIVLYVRAILFLMVTKPSL